MPDCLRSTSAKKSKPILSPKELGKHWRITEYSFKPYPCCRCNHTPIGLGIKLREQGVKPADVRSVEIGMGNVNWLTVGEPYDVRRDSVVHAQFNAAYSVCARVDGCARRFAQLSEARDQRSGDRCARRAKSA